MRVVAPSAVYLTLVGVISLVPASGAYVTTGFRSTRPSLSKAAVLVGLPPPPTTTTCRRATRSSEPEAVPDEGSGGENKHQDALRIVGSSARMQGATRDRSLPAGTPSRGRREFLLSSAAAVALASAPSASPAAELPGSAAESALAVSASEAAAGAAAAATAAPASSDAAVRLPPMGLGAWSWGDSLFWGYDKKNDDELQKVFDYAVESFENRNEATLLDTAEIYGLGRSETLVGQFSAAYPSDKVVVATKFAALPFRSSSKDVVKACKASLKRLNRESIDLYQIHFPNAWSNAEYWDGLADCVDQGLVRAVGVSNYGVDAVRACHDALQKRGIPLATNQIQFSLLYRYPIDNGLLQCCQDLGVQVLSYSPLALGMLTGKYTKDSPPNGPRKALYEKLAASSDYDNLLAIMKDVAAVRPGATLSQVALNWARAKGTIPIPGARTMSQIQQNLESLSWSLSPEEERALDVAASKVTSFITPADSFFVKEDRNTGLKMFDS